jgi:hypothetical protein
MFDLDRHEIEIPCPGCGFLGAATLKQIRLDDVIICGGCKANIRLIDYMSEIANTRRCLQQALQRLVRATPRTINISLRF